MGLVLRFWSRLGAWTGLLLAFLVGVSLASGQPAAEVLAHLPTWAGLALALAAFPAGVSVASAVFPARRLVPWRILEIVVACAFVSVLLFSVGNAVGPAVSRIVSSEAGRATVAEPTRMSLSELRSAAKEAVARARKESASVQQWQEANRLVWHLVRRTDGTALPFLFGLIGVLTGFWSSRVTRPELQQLQQWAMGLFLLMVTYLAGENSYELIVNRSAGPVFFAGDLVLVVPALLLAGLGWPTLVTLLCSNRPEETPIDPTLSR